MEGWSDHCLIEYDGKCLPHSSYAIEWIVIYEKEIKVLLIMNKQVSSVQVLVITLERKRENRTSKSTLII